jgi:hypothetical protein
MRREEHHHVGILKHPILQADRIRAPQAEFNPSPSTPAIKIAQLNSVLRRVDKSFFVLYRLNALNRNASRFDIAAVD